MRAERLLNTDKVRSQHGGKGIPRLIEVFVVSICIVITLPLFVVLSLIVALNSRGLVIFRQSRVGRRGRVFTLYKFRTMHCDSNGLQITAADDNRVTRVGKMLRRTKLDELPELLNVLKGDMSLVGPRPEIPCYVDLESYDWLQLLEVRPGLTDPVTIRMRNEEELLALINGDRERFYVEQLLPHKIAGSLEYLKQRSWVSDVRVLWNTCLTFTGIRNADLMSTGWAGRQCLDTAPSLTVGVLPLRLASLNGRTPGVSAGVDCSSVIESSFDTAAADLSYASSLPDEMT